MKVTVSQTRTKWTAKPHRLDVLAAGGVAQELAQAWHPKGNRLVLTDAQHQRMENVQEFRRELALRALQCPEDEFVQLWERSEQPILELNAPGLSVRAWTTEDARIAERLRTRMGSAAYRYDARWLSGSIISVAV